MLTQVIGIRRAVIEVIKINDPTQSVYLILSLILPSLGLSFRKNGIVKKESR
jgi:hypothetical protein